MKSFCTYFVRIFVDVLKSYVFVECVRYYWYCAHSKQHVFIRVGYMGVCCAQEFAHDIGKKIGAFTTVDETNNKLVADASFSTHLL